MYIFTKKQRALLVNLINTIAEINEESLNDDIFSYQIDKLFYFDIIDNNELEVAQIFNDITE